ncbi:MAG: NFACT family protein [Acidobacteria bacterium]|nr:NFACT family protein [Acidobacteriota bacterium]
MDIFLLQAIAKELEPLLVGHRLGKIVQLSTTDVALDFRLRDGRWLVISTDPARLALYLTARQPKQLSDEPRTDTGFVVLLKKYLGSAKLLAIEPLGYDRVASFHFEAEEETSELKQRTLVVSLTGRTANLVLTEAGQILARLRESEERKSPAKPHEKHTKERGRESGNEGINSPSLPLSVPPSLNHRSVVGEKFDYPPPPADKLDPFQCSTAQLYELIAQAGGDIATAAQKSFIGFTPLYARELAYRAKLSEPELALRNLLADLFEANPVPTIYSSPSIEALKQKIGRDEFSLTLSPIELRHLFALEPRLFPTVNEAADVYFSLLEDRRRFLAGRQKLTSQLSAKLKKQRTLVANLERELAGFARGETHQRWGELLLANLHQAEKTDPGFAVTDFYDEAQATITIPAADKATAQDAAEHYFKLARKAKNGQAAISARLPEVRKEIAELENNLARVSEVTRAEELQPLLKALIPASPKLPKPKTQPGKKPKEEKISGVRRYRCTDGYEILVGRTDRDNDNLTLRVAKSYDLWFHAADYPGSHVVLRNPQRREVPPRAITEAAELAAKFSSARTNAKVAVNYCEKKFVTKPKGFAPGQVRLASFKTVMVEPKESAERLP